MNSVQIYLAGLKSRVAAYDLSSVFEEKLTNLNKLTLIKLLKDNSLNIEILFDEVTNKWVKLFTIEHENTSENKLTQIGDFTLNTKEPESDQLSVRSFNGSLYLCNAELTDRIAITSSNELPFESIANNPKAYFEKKNSQWTMRIRGESQTD